MEASVSRMRCLPAIVQPSKITFHTAPRYSVAPQDRGNVLVLASPWLFGWWWIGDFEQVFGSVVVGVSVQNPGLAPSVYRFVGHPESVGGFQGRQQPAFAQPLMADLRA